MFIIHGAGLLLCLVLLLCVRQQDHLRWNLGYAIVWLTTLSGLVVCFFKTRRKLVNVLLRVYGFLWLCWFVLLPLCTMGLWLLLIIEIYIPHETFYKTDGYVMRQDVYDFMDFPECVLLKNNGLTGLPTCSRLTTEHIMPTKMRWNGCAKPCGKSEFGTCRPCK